VNSRRYGVVRKLESRKIQLSKYTTFSGDCQALYIHSKQLHIMQAVRRRLLNAVKDHVRPAVVGLLTGNALPLRRCGSPEPQWLFRRGISPLLFRRGMRPRMPGTTMRGGGRLRPPRAAVVARQNHNGSAPLPRNYATRSRALPPSPIPATAPTDPTRRSVLASAGEPKVSSLRRCRSPDRQWRHCDSGESQRRSPQP